MAILAGILYTQGIFTPPVQVQIVTVSQIYPSQTLIVLNASGYVVPQRKSALDSKVTGRLIWLGVEEGNRVKKDQIIARLESQDVEAAKDQATANVNASRFTLEQTKAELAHQLFGRGGQTTAFLEDQFPEILRPDLHRAGPESIPDRAEKFDKMRREFFPVDPSTTPNAARQQSLLR